MGAFSTEARAAASSILAMPMLSHRAGGESPPYSKHLKSISTP